MKRIAQLPSHIEFPLQFVQSGAAPDLIYGTADVDDGTVNANIHRASLDDISSSTTLTSSTSDYACTKTVVVNGELWVICTEYRDRAKRIVLIQCASDGERTIRYLTDYGQFDNPTLIDHGGVLHVAWEDQTGRNCRIAATLLGADSEDLRVAYVTEPTERANNPVYASAGGVLYLFYESFFEKRYHVMVRCLTPGDRRLGHPVEVGFDTCHDNSPAVCALGDKVVVAWENSSPLYTDFRWESASGRTVTMPSFGHGWRVESRLGLRRVSLVKGELILESLPADDLWNASPQVGAGESSGKARVFADGCGRLYLAWVEIVGKRWAVRISRLDGESWTELEDVAVSTYARHQPSVASDGDGLLIAGEIGEGDTLAKSVVAVDLPASSDESKAAFVPVKRVRLARVTADPTAETDPRQAIQYEGRKLGLYWGDLHMHSNVSVCSLGTRFHCTEVQAKYAFSRDVGRLDFAMITDHDVMSQREWVETIKAAHLANRDGEFVAFVGFEWTSSQRSGPHNYGHYNVLYRDEGPLFRVREPDGDAIDKVWDQLSVGEALTIPHHPGEGVHRLDWDYYDERFEPLVEIYQVRGSYESDGCAMHPELYGRTVKPGHSIQHGLNRGYRFGFTSGGEHEGVGLTGIYAEELTRDGIFQALRKRQVFGTTSEKILLDYRIDGHLMGSEIARGEGDGTFTCQVKVVGTDAIETIDLVQADTTTSLYRGEEWGESTVELQVDVPLGQSGEWYYVRLKQVDGHMAWSSPIWIDIA